MLNEDLIAKFKSAGAQSVAGSIILNRETVALLRADQVILTPEGEEALRHIDARAKKQAAAVEVEVKEVKPAPAAKTTRAKRETTPAPTPDPAADPTADLDSLLTGDQ